MGTNYGYLDGGAVACKAECSAGERSKRNECGAVHDDIVKGPLPWENVERFEADLLGLGWFGVAAGDYGEQWFCPRHGAEARQYFEMMKINGHQPSLRGTRT